jgi:GTPase SAR1 family protein
MGHAVFVFGAAGAGKTTFCRNLREFGLPKRNIRLINLDPAQENGSDYDLDLCEYITVKEIMENCDYGPNGALFYALKEMCDNLEELDLQEFENDYFIFDCPGQIELFIHSEILQTCVKHVKNFAKVAIVYLIDSTNFMSHNKLMYSLLCATVSMYRFYLPVLNIVTKCDLLDEDKLHQIISGEDVFQNQNIDEKDTGLDNAIVEYVNSHGMLDFIPLDWKNEEMVENIFLSLDNVLQRYDDDEPRETTE